MAQTKKQEEEVKQAMQQKQSKFLGKRPIKKKKETVKDGFFDIDKEASTYYPKSSVINTKKHQNSVTQGLVVNQPKRKSVFRRSVI